MHLTCIVGARPNFPKMAPIIDAARRAGIETTLVHTGQHYDAALSDSFFAELDLPRPDVHLGVGSGSHAVQTAKVMEAFDAVLDQRHTDMVVVVGDVNSTLACALVAAKRLVPVAHVEAGLRSLDRTMPEEINRVLTDQLADLLFTTERTATEHLVREGVSEQRIHFVGNVMIDTLLKHRATARTRGVLGRLDLNPRNFALVTIHRPSNVDSESPARKTAAAIRVLGERFRVVVPLHPRTRSRFCQFDLLDDLIAAGICVLEPQSYFDFLALMDNAAVVLTDSGGIQEETTALGVPCMTFRENTERPITITEGTNQLVGTDPTRVREALDEILQHPKSGRIPELWDGHAGERIITVIAAPRGGGGASVSEGYGSSALGAAATCQT